jgi:dTDP-4-amino-4,6-dideoxygalactose transaminase
MAQAKTPEYKAQYKVPFGTVSITEDARELIDKILKSKWVTKGRYVQEFEEKFARIFGVKEAVAVSSGTDADALACAALYDFGAERGDEIIVPALTFVATANAVLQAGFKPVFVDVTKETLNIDVEKLEKAITPRTRAIMPVHLMGKPAEMDTVLAIAKKHDLYVIEDAAEAHGAEYKGRKIGAIGDMACFSLYAAHIITTIEGGIVITDNEQMAAALRSLRNHGIEGKFTFKRIGFSAKMNEIEAAVGLGNVRIFSDILNRRRQNLLYLIEKFQRFDKYFFSIQEEPHEKIGPHAFPITLRENVGFAKDEFVDFLDGRGIDSRNLFYSIPTQCPSYAFLGHKPGDFPASEYLSDHGCHIGIHQDLDLEHMDYVVDVVEEFLRRKGETDF